MDSVRFKPCDWLQVSKRMSMKIPHKFQVRSTGSCATVWTGPLKVFGRPSVSRSFSVEDVQMLEQHRPKARSSFSNLYTELAFSRHYLESFR
jgi:hypothetical protein